MGNRPTPRTFLIPIVVVVVAGLAVWIGLGLRSAPESSLDLVGFIDGDLVRLAAKVAGRVDKVPVQDGSVVNAGDVVAALEREDFQVRVDQAEASLATARARVVQAERSLAHDASLSEAQIGQAKASLEMEREQVRQVTETAELAKKEYDRAAQLLKTGVGTQQEFDRRESDLQTAQSALLEEQSRVRERESALRVAETTRDIVKMREAEAETAKRLVREAEVAVEQARLDLRNSVTLAPIPGTILVRQTLPGEIVQVGTPIATLVDLDRLWVAVDVEESYVSRIALGDEVQVQLPSDPDHGRAGKITLIAQQSDFATQKDIGRNKVDVKTFRLKVAIDNADRTFKLGMTARVRLALRDLGAKNS
ncbi:MAG: HlyD family secretion protein [Planctomycetes bacterium]|nr:HlyD family secretion protein [Planctomycetota bacterium]MBI3846224.1 HlyD family secretion protein [Planctomycetota bacterium]